MNGNSLALAQQFTDRDLIEAVVNTYFIIDYGVVDKVNGDTVDVTHAKIQELEDGTKLPALKTKGVELLTISTAGLSIKADVKAGDKVLLLGLKDYVPAVKDVCDASAQTAFLHYKRDGMKALPLCVFNSEAKIKIEASDGVLKVGADHVEVNGNTKHLVTWEDLNNALSVLYTALTTTPIVGNGSMQPQWEGLTGGIDISAAKSANILTD